MSVSKYQYQIYGLRVSSSMELVELSANRMEADVDDDVVAITDGAVPVVPAGAVCVAPGTWAFGDAVWMEYDGVCRMVVRDGKQIVFERAGGVDPRALRLYILGNGIGVILHQRGMLAIHAGAVQVGGAAVGFLGFSGSGKSTMTAAMVNLGYPLVADDIVVVDMSHPSTPVVRPGYPRMKLHPEVARVLDCPASSLSSLHPYSDKLDHEVAHRVSQEAVPLGALYVLETSTSTQPDITPLRPAEAIVELTRHSYAAKLIAAQPSAAHFQQCAGIVRAVPVSVLRRPLNLSDLPNVARMVEGDRLANVSV